MVSLTGNVTVDEDGSAEFRCEIDANPMNKGQLISKDIFFGVNSSNGKTQNVSKIDPKLQAVMVNFEQMFVFIFGRIDIIERRYFLKLSDL